MKTQDIRQKLKDGGKALGTWCIIPSEATAHICAKSGLDFIIIDQEHGSIDLHCASTMISAAHSEGCSALVRVSSNNEPEILKALDMGADGIIVPHIDSSQERKKAISYIKYPPEGIRGYTPYARAGGYHLREGHTISENQRVLAGIIIEGSKGIENLDSIIDDPSLDMVYIGAYDISSYLGIPGDTSNPKVKEIITECTKRIRSKGKAVGALFHDPNELRSFNDLGIQLLCYRVDSDLLYAALKDIVSDFSKG